MAHHSIIFCHLELHYPQRRRVVSARRSNQSSTTSSTDCTSGHQPAIDVLTDAPAVPRDPGDTAFLDSHSTSDLGPPCGSRSFCFGGKWGRVRPQRFFCRRSRICRARPSITRSLRRRPSSPSSAVCARITNRLANRSTGLPTGGLTRPLFYLLVLQ